MPLIEATRSLLQKGKYSHMHSAVAMAPLYIIADPPRVAALKEQAEEYVADSVADHPKQHTLLKEGLEDPHQAQAEYVSPSRVPQSHL